MFVEPELVELREELSVISGGGSNLFLCLPGSTNDALSLTAQHQRTPPAQHKSVASQQRQHMLSAAAAAASSLQQQRHENVADTHLMQLRQLRHSPQRHAAPRHDTSVTSSTLDQLRDYFAAQRAPSSTAAPRSGGGTGSSCSSDNAQPSRRITELRQHFAAQARGARKSSSQSARMQSAAAATAPGVLGMLVSIGVMAADGSGAHSSKADPTELWRRSRRAEQTHAFEARQQALLDSRRRVRATAATPTTAPPALLTSRSASPAPSMPPHLRPHSAGQQQHIDRPRRCSSAPTVASRLRLRATAQSLERDYLRRQEEAAARFAPRITAAARRMATDNGAGGDDHNAVHEALFRDHARIEARRAQLRAQSLERERRALPFAPVVPLSRRSSSMLRSQQRAESGACAPLAADVDGYLRAAREREQQLELVRREVAAMQRRREMAECTFRPATTPLPMFVQRLRRTH